VAEAALGLRVRKKPTLAIWFIAPKAGLVDCSFGVRREGFLGVHLEPTVAVLRVGEELNEYGDPYEFSATVIIRGRQAEIVGGAGRFDPNWRHAISKELRAWGIDEVIFERKKAVPRSVRLKRQKAKREPYNLRTMALAGEG
jgi:hypothetical protein